ncbi:MAG: hypothetical protein KAQ85_06235, partial [Thermodesulfovibrionia bacterium]|nr:hypothetical protein [Thermodesulfovibrionia bacterium]
IATLPLVARNDNVKVFNAFAIVMDKREFCDVCEKPEEECICCPECGHICSLDNGELYCPVCFPEIKSDG